jgi:hypothetical protein
MTRTLLVALLVLSGCLDADGFDAPPESSAPVVGSPSRGRSSSVADPDTAAAPDSGPAAAAADSGSEVAGVEAPDQSWSAASRCGGSNWAYSCDVPGTRCPEMYLLLVGQVTCLPSDVTNGVVCGSPLTNYASPGAPGWCMTTLAHPQDIVWGNVQTGWRPLTTATKLVALCTVDSRFAGWACL